MSFSFRTKVNAGFILSFVFLLVISFYSYNNTNLLVKTAESVSHTEVVKANIEKAISEMKDMETGQRGYIISGRDEYLEPYKNAALTINQTLNQLQQITSDNSVQQKNIKDFIDLKDQKIAKMQESIQLRKEKGFEATRQIVLNNSGKILMDKMRQIAAQMHAEEDRLLAIRNAKAQESTQITMSVIVSGGLISALTILLALIMLNRAETERLKASLKLESLNRIRSRLIELNENMFGEKSLIDLAKNVINKIAIYSNVPVGALYLADEADSLKFVDGYAFQPSEGKGSEFKFGEGLIGQAALQKTILISSDLPEDYFKITSGLGEGRPRFVYAIPFLHNDQVKGVIELGSFSALTDECLEFLNLSLDRIAMAFNSAQSRLKVLELLQETQAQSEELQAQQEELRINNEELAETSRELEAQQEELRQANEELEEQRAGLEAQSEIAAQASRYKSEFLANMSHELRTPLNSQLILSQMLAENKEGNLTEQQKNFANTIYSSGLDLLQLINDILDLSKVEAGKLDLNITDFALQDIIEEWKRTFSANAENKNLTFQVHIDPTVPTSIYSDSHRLSQIIKNFLSNAFKFTSHGGVRVHIGQASPKEVALAKLTGLRYIALRVIDTGIGIPSEKMEKVFQAFEQVDSSISRQYGGTGLGLAICKKLADLLGGEVLAFSELGKGSTFTLLIPEIASSATTAHTNKKPTEAPLDTATSTSSSKVLIIDDNEYLSKAFAELATSAGYSVHIASSAAEAFEYLTTEKPMGIVLDYSLPDMNGLEILKKIKTTPATADLPVYLVSGADIGIEVEKMGALGFLLKPTSSKSFLQALEKIKISSKIKKKRLLVVEDNETQLNHITQKLQSDRITVISTRSAEEAMRILESQGAFDCIILDLHLTDMSGFNMLKRMNEQKINTPVIIHTAVDLDKAEEAQLRQYSESIVVKGDHSGQRLLDEVNLLLTKAQSTNSTQDKKPSSLFSAEAIFSGKHILIADDDARNIFALSNALTAKGLTISSVQNGQEALDALNSSTNFDLVLMDVMMPVIDGLEAMKRIRKKPHGHDIPIIALTAKAMKGSREACIAAGANDYLSKPVDMDRLIALLRIWLAKK